jgi:hypothetical protein
MKPEQKFYNWLKKNQVLIGDYSRVENSADDGTPDINLGYDGQDGWIELKVGNPKYLTTRLLRTSQKVWHFRRAIQGVLVLVLIKFKFEVYLYRAHASHVPSERYRLVYSGPTSDARSLMSELKQQFKHGGILHGK